jgi:hypothetical protein
MALAKKSRNVFARVSNFLQEIHEKIYLHANQNATLNCFEDTLASALVPDNVPHPSVKHIKFSNRKFD